MVVRPPDVPPSEGLSWGSRSRAVDEDPARDLAPPSPPRAAEGGRAAGPKARDQGLDSELSFELHR